MEAGVWHGGGACAPVKGANQSLLAKLKQRLWALRRAHSRPAFGEYRLPSTGPPPPPRAARGHKSLPTPAYCVSRVGRGLSARGPVPGGQQHCRDPARSTGPLVPDLPSSDCTCRTTKGAIPVPSPPPRIGWSVRAGRRDQEICLPAACQSPITHSDSLLIIPDQWESAGWGRDHADCLLPPPLPPVTTATD